PDFFSLLGVTASRGREFSSSIALNETADLAVLSDAFWRREFDTRDSIIGRTILLNDRPFQVIGVMPARFTYPERTDVWIPAARPGSGARMEMFSTSIDLVVVGRLAANVSLPQARTAMTTIDYRFRREHPSGLSWDRADVVSLRAQLLGNSERRLWMGLGFVVILLILACVNVAGLLLTNGFARRDEIRLRAALGAAIGRIFRQLLTESLVIAGLGGAIGLIIAWAFCRYLGSLMPTELAEVNPPSLGWRIVAFTLAISTFATILFGLLPATALMRRSDQLSFRSSARWTVAALPNRFHSTIAVVQLGLALALVIGAGLLLKSLFALDHVRLGFRRDGVLAATVALPVARYPSASARAVLYREALNRIANVPGVESVGLVNSLPLRPGAAAFSFQITELPPFPNENAPRAQFLVASEGYFRTLEIPVIAGRTFKDSDTGNDAHGVVISKKMADLFWPTVSPLGSHLRIPTDSANLTIVGVATPVRTTSVLEEDAWQGQMYLSFAQVTPGIVTFVVRGIVGKDELANSIRRALAVVDPQLPLYNIESMKEVVDTTLAPQRASTLLISIAAALAFSLAIVGVYGVMAERVQQRSREFGVRTAIGASPTDILVLVLRDVTRLSLLGLGVGSLVAYLASRLLAHLLYTVSQTDATVYVLGALLLVFASLLAGALPAIRASKADPCLALRVN
ncbi:MAG TPA: ADOP family duplicated permease, partial [Gemmatimonadaceae bacterium]|nr:ADOP family duplicated permease [Gemmatimonadaceae bacterium]